ncbi:collagen-binding domain-containing protein [Companilactobacillus kimchii]|uniref:Glutamyl endopeptidase n=3 Tax=Companilactobacillus kimchii TaxID=2801452 RepID=A0A210PBD8_9LACO|nr:collagen-binding domain-containing protein [Companilactobacillus kimchii]KAE9558756.1 hypothetical protein ATN91_14270 [Companilactobacillus kimchii]KAE9560985.1 hypothetical protein ATN91_09430 [Companilactobacillus kimchii]OWF33818.1 Glutamyl endopeptidase [Companilactobacillus kimchii]
MLMRKGKKWALSCVAISAVVLTGMSATTVNADETDSATATTQSTGNQTDQNQTSGNNVQAAKGAVTQSTVQDTTNTADSTNATQTASAQSSATAQAPVATQSSTSGVAAQSAESNTEATSRVANSAVRPGGKFEDDIKRDDPDIEKNNELGYASYFHIFAREAQLKAHTNGNVAVQHLDGGVNFGTNTTEQGLLNKDISYIQNITNIAQSSFVSSGDTRENKVVFGENVDIDISNPNRPTVDGKDMDHLVAQEVYQDKDGNYYIDFDKYFQELEDKSTELSNKDSQMTITNGDFPDMNQRVIDLSRFEPDENNQIVLNLDPEVLNMATPLTIYGLSKDAGGTNIIVNVDTKGVDEYKINSQIKLIYSDGSTSEERPNQETEYFDDNHLLWNFYDSTKDDNLYEGTVNVDKPFQGSVLNPKGTIIANQNLDGNIIADKVVVNAETHRWDFQDNNKKETEYDNVVTLPAEGVVPPVFPVDPDDNNHEGNEGNTTDPEDPDENNNEDNGGSTTDPENPDENNNEDNGGGTTDPENPDENNNEDNNGNEDGDGNDGDNPTDPKDPDESNNEDEDDTTGTDENGGKPDEEKPGEEDNGVTPDTDKEEEEDSDSEETTTGEDGNQNLINGGSEGSQSEDNAEEGLLPNTSGNKGESETPATGTSDEAGTLPQTGEASSIFATIAGVFLIIFGFLLKTTKTKKN